MSTGLLFYVLIQGCYCRFRGIGIRIEDEVLITETGYEVATSNQNSFSNVTAF